MKIATKRQRERREREKVWLEKHGFKSWERLHTLLVNEFVELRVVKDIPPLHKVRYSKYPPSNNRIE